MEVSADSRPAAGISPPGHPVADPCPHSVSQGRLGNDQLSPEHWCPSPFLVADSSQTCGCGGKNPCCRQMCWSWLSPC